jgi:hypothetical protein
MKFAFLIYVENYNAAGEMPSDQGDDIAEHIAFTRDAIEKGRYVTCEALAVANTSATVRVRGGKPIRTDGPFAETKEVLGGFYVLECKDLDEAVELASGIPPAKHGAIEVRPVLDIPGWDEAIGLSPRAAI